MEQLRSKLEGVMLPTITRASLGVSVIIAWSLIVSSVVPSCPTQEGGVVSRVTVPHLGENGLIVWAFLLATASWDFKEQRIWLTLALVAIGLASALLGEPMFLVIASMVMVCLVAVTDMRGLLEAVALGIITVELLTLFYLLFRAYTVKLPALATLPLHLSLYCFYVPLAPVIVFVTCLSPFLTLFRKERAQAEWQPRRKTALAMGLMLCVLIWVIIYASELNRGSKLIGVDSNTRYYPHAIQLIASGYPGVLKLGYDRPLYYFFLYKLASSLGAREAVMVLPFVALTLYTVASYLAAKELAGERVAGIASIVAPLTYTTTAGLYGGLYNNWTALSIALMAVFSFARWLKRGNVLWFFTYLLMLVGVVATHVYMGSVFFVSTLFTIILSTFIRKYWKRALLALAAQLFLAALGFHIAEDLAVDLNFRSPSKVISSLTQAWKRRIEMLQFFSPAWWNDYSFAIYMYAATAALDPTVWVSTMIGIASLKVTDLSSLVLIPWLFIAYILSFTAPYELIFRALYDYPYSVTEALGLAFTASTLREKFGMKVTLSWILAILLFKLNYTLLFAIGLAS